MKRERGVWVYVSPEFRTNLKIASANNNCSMVELTRQLAKNLNNEQQQSNEVKLGKRFSFKL